MHDKADITLTLNDTDRNALRTAVSSEIARLQGMQVKFEHRDKPLDLINQRLDILYPLFKALEEPVKNIYTRNGWADRTAYLRQMADDNGMTLHAVRETASLLGEDEDFDGLISALHDISLGENS